MAFFIENAAMFYSAKGTSKPFAKQVVLWRLTSAITAIRPASCTHGYSEEQGANRARAHREAKANTTAAKAHDKTLVLLYRKNCQQNWTVDKSFMLNHHFGF